VGERFSVRETKMRDLYLGESYGASRPKRDESGYLQIGREVLRTTGRQRGLLRTYGHKEHAGESCQQAGILPKGGETRTHVRVEPRYKKRVSTLNKRKGFFNEKKGSGKCPANAIQDFSFVKKGRLIKV